MQKTLLTLCFILFFALGCQQGTAVSNPQPESTNTAVASKILSNSSGVVAERIDTSQPPERWPAALAPLPNLVRTAVTPAQQASWQALSQPSAPERNDAQLAQAYRSLPNNSPSQKPSKETLSLGTETTFNISQDQTNTIIPIEVALLGVSEHAYFWFDTGPGAAHPTETAVDTMGSLFDEIYTEVEAIYGQADVGLDDDPRVHIVTASPLALCDVTLATAADCGLAGYFNSSDTLSSAINPNSNERNMSVMNADWFGTDFFLTVLGHEFRHLIEENYDASEEGWEIEGSATLAEDLLGFRDNARQRANRFLENPNLQLNSWTNADKLPHYGQGYLLNRYLYDQLGETYYREFVQRPENGLQAIDALAAKYDLPLNGQELWLEWLAALAIHKHPNAPRAYRFNDTGIHQAAATTIRKLPTSLEEQVSQYAANYYRLPAGESLVIDFTGSTAVPTLPVLPPSGQTMWLAERGNFINPQLTRTVDLTNMDEATLEYSAFVDLEHGFDFGYVAVSTDNGRSWQPLSAPHMQGLQPNDDPAQTALASRFYTGHSPTWLEESIDLTPYTGQPIQIRFDLVTDPATSYNGFALDNIAIPEIGFYDDAETLANGWHAAGFTRSTAYLPQTWHLQIITFPNDIPNVTTLPLQPDQTGAYLVESQAGEDNPILIIAASAPNTLQPAHYQLAITEQ